MEIKARLKKPYEEEDRLNFLIEQNQKNGYTIKETEEELQAWGYTEKERKEQEKERIAQLSMTKLDFYKYALQPNGIDYAKLQEILHTSEEMNACWQLCERVYRGDEVLCKAVEKFLPEIDLDEIFKERGK